jgi:hypothetical protein
MLEYREKIYNIEIMQSISYLYITVIIFNNCSSLKLKILRNKWVDIANRYKHEIHFADKLSNDCSKKKT